MNAKLALRKLSRVVNSIRGTDYFETVDLHRNVVELGSDYGGWLIDVDAVKADAVVYSAGVGEDVSFDLALMDRCGVTVHAFDPTPRSIQWVKAQQLPPTFVMHDYGFADVDGEIELFAPINPGRVSHSIVNRAGATGRSLKLPVKKLSTIMRELGHDRIDVLKMDIEGAEYGLIEWLCGTAIRPQQVLVEFHHRFPGIGIEKTKRAIQSLRGIGYGVVGVSNTGLEYSLFYRGADA
jgi:FkbM family methyltransferase